jgi:hypothetical protein
LGNIQEGTKFYKDGESWTLKAQGYDRDLYEADSFRIYRSYHDTYEYTRFELVSPQGITKILTGTAIYDFLDHVIFNPNAGFELGDRFEIKRAGLDPNLRGKLVEIDQNAEQWPYRIEGPDGNSSWFSVTELTKLHSVTSFERSGAAKQALQVQIEAKRAELEALEVALEVLEYAS